MVIVIFSSLAMLIQVDINSDNGLESGSGIARATAQFRKI